MSNFRHPADDLLVRASAVGFSSGYHWQRGAMDWGVLLWASRGATAVMIDASLWVIAPHQAVWVPAGVTPPWPAFAVRRVTASHGTDECSMQAQRDGIQR